MAINRVAAAPILVVALAAAMNRFAAALVVALAGRRESLATAVVVALAVAGNRFATVVVVALAVAGNRFAAAMVVTLTLVLLGTMPAMAHQLTRDELGQVGFRQHQGDPLPLDLAFNDENGEQVLLGQYFTSKPVILTLNYLHCQNLCALELHGVVDGLNGVPFTLGDQYTLLTISFDPRETPHDALNARFRAIRGYIHPESSTTWHVLTTADQSAIDRLTRAVGFEYVYDPQEDDYAHPSGVVVLTPKGQISRYIYGLNYSANDLRLGLLEAASERIGSLVDQVLLVCYHYDAVTGRYTPLVMNILAAAAGVTVLVVGISILLMFRADLRMAHPLAQRGQAPQPFARPQQGTPASDCTDGSAATPRPGRGRRAAPGEWPSATGEP